MSGASRPLTVALLAGLLIGSCARPTVIPASIRLLSTVTTAPGPNDTGTPAATSGPTSAATSGTGVQLAGTDDHPLPDPHPQDPVGEGSGPGTPTPDPNATLILLNPCSLVTQGEAASAVGEPVDKPIRVGGGCVYVDTASRRHLLTAFAVSAADSADTVAGRLYLLGGFGLQFTTQEADQLRALGTSGDLKGVVENLLAMTRNSTGFKAKEVEGLGDAAMWASKELGIVRQGFVLVARGDALAGLDLVVTSARDDASLHDTAKTLAGRMLDRLPEKFTASIASPTPAIEVTVIPAAVLTEAAASAAAASASPPPATGVPTLTRTPDVDPPAFSQSVLSSNQLVYGGDCGTRWVTLTVKVIDPSNVYGIQSAFVALRLVESAAGGDAGDWTLLPMRAEGGDVWSRTIFSEVDVPNYNAFPSAVVEYYFVAINGAGVSGESPRRGLELISCAAAGP